MSNIKLWEPILILNQIPTKYHEKVSNHLQHLQELEIKHVSISDVNSNNSLVPINLKIISKIRDLSKVTFLEKPGEKLPNVGRITTDIIQVSDKISRESIQTVHYDLDEIEDIILYKIINDVNKRIEEGEHIYVYMLCQTVSIIAEASFSPKISITGRYTSKKI